MPDRRSDKPTTHKALLLLTLLIFLGQSVGRLLFVPLWAHYDEYSHYIFVRYIAVMGALPQADSPTPQTILAEVEASYPAQNIVWATCHELATLPPESVCLYPNHQFAQQQPGYYLVQALIQRAVNPATIEGRMRLGAAVSLALSLSAALMVWAMLRAAFPRGPLLAYGVVLLMSLVIGFVDITSAVSNDVGAIFALSLLLFTLTLIVRNGLSLPAVALVLVGAGACYFSKASAWVGLPLIPLGLVLAYWEKIPSLARIAMGVTLTGAVFLLFDLTPPAAWQRTEMRDQPGRSLEAAQIGRASFIIDAAQAPSARLAQVLHPDVAARLAGRSVTFGAWMRSTQTHQAARAPLLWDGFDEYGGGPVTLNQSWRFVAVQAALPEQLPTLVLTLPGTPGTVTYFDGLVMAEGDYAQGSVPEFTHPAALTGIWGNQPFDNLVRNPSAERTWLMLRPEVDQRLPKSGFNQNLESLYDWRRTWPVYLDTIRWQFVSFWSAFLGGLTGLPRAGVAPLALLTALSLAGWAKLLIIVKPRPAPYQVKLLIIYILAVVGAFGQNLLFVYPVDAFGRSAFIPTARLAYVAIGPTLALLLIGLGGWFMRGRTRRLGLAGVVIGLYGLYVWSLLNVQIPAYIVHSTY